MAEGGRQLALPFDPAPDGGRAHFIVSAANADAVTLAGQWRAWPAGAALILGPEGSGKSHLARVWAAEAGASRLVPAALVPESVLALPTGAYVLDDADTVPDAQGAALYHLLNRCAAGQLAVLLTARRPSGDWNVTLPDARTRVAALATARLAQPDDAMLAGIVVKLFADRHILVREDVVEWLLKRIDRSVPAAQAAVDRIDEAALAAGAAVTVPFVARLFAGTEAGGDAPAA